VYKKSYKMYCSDSYVEDVNNICWSVVWNEEQPDAALDAWMKQIVAVTNNHEPIKNVTVKPVQSLWFDEKLYGWEGFNLFYLTSQFS
jgi:hypothetical protein